MRESEWGERAQVSSLLFYRFQLVRINATCALCLAGRHSLPLTVQRESPSSERGGGALALSLDGVGVSLFFLIFFATGANLCWRRLARALPAKACTLLCEPGASAHTIYSNFPVSLLSLFEGKKGFAAQVCSTYVGPSI